MANLSSRTQNVLIATLLALLVCVMALTIGLVVAIWFATRPAASSTPAQTLEGSAPRGLEDHQVDADGVSRGYNMDEFKANFQYVYQVIAYPRDSFSGANYPAVRASFTSEPVAPFTEQPNDYGYVWVGATLNNKYFIQTGLATSHNVNADGTMEWHVFWQVWDDTGKFISSFDDKLSNYSDLMENTFSIVCVDPAVGDWEFRLNGKAIGRANTKDCAMNVANSSLAFEVVSDTPADGQFYDEHGNEIKRTVPELTTRLGDMQYWDGAVWNQVQKGVLSYGAGDTDSGTQVDQQVVCELYGAGPLDATHFAAGSFVDCAPIGSLIWTDTPL